MFAAVNGNVIHIYSVTSFENILSLKGHNGKVSQAGVYHKTCGISQRLVIFVKPLGSGNNASKTYSTKMNFFAGAWHWMEPGRQPASVMWDGGRSVRVEHTVGQACLWERPQLVQLHRCCLLFRLQEHPGCGDRPHTEGNPGLSGQYWMSRSAMSLEYC